MFNQWAKTTFVKKENSNENSIYKSSVWNIVMFVAITMVVLSHIPVSQEIAGQEWYKFYYSVLNLSVPLIVASLGFNFVRSYQKENFKFFLKDFWAHFSMFLVVWVVLTAITPVAADGGTLSNQHHYWWAFLYAGMMIMFVLARYMNIKLEHLLIASVVGVIFTFATNVSWDGSWTIDNWYTSTDWSGMNQFISGPFFFFYFILFGWVLNWLMKEGQDKWMVAGVASVAIAAYITQLSVVGTKDANTFGLTYSFLNPFNYMAAVGLISLASLGLRKSSVNVEFGKNAYVLYLTHYVVFSIFESVAFEHQGMHNFMYGETFGLYWVTVLAIAWPLANGFAFVWNKTKMVIAEDRAK